MLWALLFHAVLSSPLDALPLWLWRLCKPTCPQRSRVSVGSRPGAGRCVSVLQGKRPPRVDDRKCRTLWNAGFPGDAATCARARLSRAVSCHCGGLVATAAARPVIHSLTPYGKACADPCSNHSTCCRFGKQKPKDPAFLSSRISFLFLVSVHVQSQRGPFVSCEGDSDVYAEGLLGEVKGVLRTECLVPEDSQAAGAMKTVFIPNRTDAPP